MAVTTAAAPRQAGLNRTTRVLCSAVLTEAAFAGLVYRALCVPQIQATPPSPGIDLVALARHAAFAVAQRRRRQTALSAALLGLLVPVLGLAAAPGMAAFWLLATVVIVVGAKAGAVAHDVGMARRATRLIDEPLGHDLGDGLVDEEVEERLRLANDANLSLYAWTRADDPFPGLGQRIDAQVRMPVDISRPQDPNLSVKEVVTSDLLDHLARSIPRYIDVTHINDTRRVRMVLYVLGSAAPHVPGVVPRPDGPAVARVQPALLRSTADHPSSEARTYLRAQIIGHGGDVVTTVHLTAVASPVGLSLDLALHVLRPVHPAFHVADRLPRSGPKLAWRFGVEAGISPGLLRAPGEGLRLTGWLQDGRRPPALTRDQRKAVGTQDFHGASIGLREVVSLNSAFRFNEKNDADRQFNDILVAVMRELITFLEARNIDTSDFRHQQMQIINNITNAVSTTVNGSYVGGQGTMTINGNQSVSAGGLPNVGQGTP